MKKVININFQGRVVPIEETAYDVLKQYIESLRRYFANEEGRDEIINDIEGRIGELFGEALKKGSTCVTDDDVNAIIASMGRPEDFDDDEARVQSQLGADNSSKSQQSTADSSSTDSSSAGSTGNAGGFARHGRFYRDENHKVVAGVCAGIANYFGIDPLVVRILFVIFAFGFGFGFITYLVLWVAVPSTASTVIGSTKKRLYRDPENKLISGVCSGLAQYFGVNVWIPRVLFLIPFLTITFHWSRLGVVDFPNFLRVAFSPGTLLIYIILWLVFPEATTTAEKLEMKGERVDLNSIKNTIQQDMEGFNDRAKRFGKEVGDRANQFGKEFGSRSRQFGAEAGSMARRGGSGVGYVIGLMVKIFLYFILGCLLFALVMALFGIGIAMTGFLPIKGFIIANGWQNIFAWGTLILFIWVPVVGIITWVIRRVAKLRSNNRTVRFVFISLWLLGLVCFIGMLSSLAMDFKYRYHPTEESVVIPQPKVDKLEIKGMMHPYLDDNDDWFQIHPFASVDGDTAFVRNTRIRLVASDNDSFTVSVKKYASGPTIKDAQELASKINFSVKQRDQVLWIDDAIAFTENEKFRNQMVDITIGVPRNKKIQIDESARGWGNNEHIDFGGNWWYRDDEDETGHHYIYDFQRGVEYKMSADGRRLIRTDGRNDNNDDDNNNGDNIDRSNQQQQSAPATSDSTKRYHYKEPSKPQAPQPAKPAGTGKDSLHTKQANADLRVTLPTAFIERFSI